jgi:hypothetical protein
VPTAATTAAEPPAGLRVGLEVTKQLGELVPHPPRPTNLPELISASSGFRGLLHTAAEALSTAPSGGPSHGVLLLVGSLGFYLWVNHFGPEAQAAGSKGTGKTGTIWRCATQRTLQTLKHPSSNPPPPTGHTNGPRAGILPVGSAAFGLGSRPLLLLSSGALLQQGMLLRRGNNPLQEANLARQQLQGLLPSHPHPLPLKGEGPDGSGFCLEVTQNKPRKWGLGDSLVITYHHGSEKMPEATPNQRAFFSGCHQGDGNLHLEKPKDDQPITRRKASMTQTGGPLDLAGLLPQTTLLKGARLYPLENNGRGFRLKVLNRDGLKHVARMLREAAMQHSSKGKHLDQLCAALQLNQPHPGAKMAPSAADPSGPTALAMALGLLLTDGCVVCSLNRRGHLTTTISVSAKNKQDLLFLDKAFCPGGSSKVYSPPSNGGEGRMGCYRWQTTSIASYQQVLDRTRNFYQQDPWFSWLQQHPKIKKMLLGEQLRQQYRLGYHRASPGTPEAEA